MDKEFIEGIQGFMGLMANEIQTEIEVPNESEDFVDYVKSETIKQVYTLYIKNTDILEHILERYMKENILFRLELGPEQAENIWWFIMKQDFWKSLLGKSIMLAYKQGKAGIGVYDITLHKFRSCKETECFRTIIEFILDYHTHYRELLEKGNSNLTNIENNQLEEFISENFILCGPGISKSLNSWDNTINKRTAEVIVRKKGLEDLKTKKG